MFKDEIILNSIPNFNLRALWSDLDKVHYQRHVEIFSGIDGDDFHALEEIDPSHRNLGFGMEAAVGVGSDGLGLGRRRSPDFVNQTGLRSMSG